MLKNISKVQYMMFWIYLCLSIDLVFTLEIDKQNKFCKLVLFAICDQEET